MKNEKVIKITDLQALEQYAKGEVVELPEFGKDMPFVARLKRPSMLCLAKTGKIPNKLLSAADSLFNTGKVDSDSASERMTNTYDVIKIICEAALIEPTLSQIEGAGLSLSDEQMMAIFNYTQLGVDALEPFRKK